MSGTANPKSGACDRGHVVETEITKMNLEFCYLAFHDKALL